MAILPFLKDKIKKTPPAPTTAPQGVISATPERLGQGMVSVKDIVAPSAIEVDFNHIKIGNTFLRTLFVSGYPRFVSANWLSPLINFDHSLQISMYVYPIEGKSVLDDLRRKIAEMEAEIASDLQRGRVVDPSTQAKLEDARSLQEQLVKGIERFFQFSLYVTIPASSPDELEQVSRQASSLLGSLLIVSKSATLQMEEAFKSTLPTCTDLLMITRNMDTTSLATTFPFTSSELTSGEGILYGINEHNESLIIFDRFSMENANSVIFAKAGAGKSIFGHDKALIDDGGGPKISSIGPVIESIISKNGAQTIDKDIEGVIKPGLKVWTFNSGLKGQWSDVSIAARKRFSPRNKLYQITTKSGRQITVTADHNLVLMRKGKIRTARSNAIKPGEAIPISRSLQSPVNEKASITPSTLVSSWPTTLPKEIPLSKYFLDLLGLMTSEGYISRHMLHIYNTDPDVLKLIKEIATELELKLYPRYNYPQREVRGFAIAPPEFRQLILALGVGGLSGTKQIPPIIFSLSNQQVAHYLSAYYEGDGGVESHGVSATTKSKDLASDLAYLLLRFGIIARLREKTKSATNTTKKTRRTYYQITISGLENIKRFSTQIGFLTNGKNEKLLALIAKNPKANTNVDTIPSLQPVFKKIYRLLYNSSEIHCPQKLVDLKNGYYNPSRKEILDVIGLCEERIAKVNSLHSNVKLLRQLPLLSTIIKRGSSNRRLNKLLWKSLGASWQIMKNSIHPPLAKNALLAYQTVSGRTLALPQINSAIYESFKEQGFSLRSYNNSLWSSIINRPPGNSGYNTIEKAAKYIARKYRSTQLKIRHAQTELKQLKILANADLFWDPIEKIEKIKHKEKYVYDLQVDNGVFLAGHGGLFVHNSYMVKLEALRSLLFGTEIIVIDPESEYKNLAEAVGGQFLTFGFNSPNRVNPFDLSAIYEEGENELGNKILNLHSLFKVIMGQLAPGEEATLDRALVLTYKMKGITPDPGTQKNEPPLMEDLYKALLGMEEPEAKTLADRIEKFVKGSFVGIFDQPSNVDITNKFTVFSLRDVEETLRPIAMFIILDYVWTKIRRDLKKRILIVDEAWYLMKYGDSAGFIYGIAKRARKYFLGLTTITQDVEDFLSTDQGKAIITNSSIQILMKQSTAAIDKLAEVFYLSEGEKHLLLAADVGEGIFFAGPNHVAMRVVASPDEHQLVTTNPQEILNRQTPKTPAVEHEKEAPPPPALDAPAFKTAPEPTISIEIPDALGSQPTTPLGTQPPTTSSPTLGSTASQYSPRPPIRTVIEPSGPPK